VKNKPSKTSKLKLAPVVVGAIAFGLLSVPFAARADFSFSNIIDGITSLGSGNFNLDSISGIVGDISSITASINSSELGNFSSSGDLSSADFNPGSSDLFSGVNTGTITDPSAGFGDPSFSELDGLGGSSGIFGSSTDTVNKILGSSSYIKGLYGAISSGNISSILDNGSSLLGSLGILDIASLSGEQGSSGATLGGGEADTSSINDEITSAKSPQQVFAAGNKRQSIYRSSNYGISQIVLGKDGQALSDSQAKESGLAVSSSQASSTKSADYLAKAADVNSSQEKAVNASQDLAKKCSEAKQTLDCQKYQSTQLAVIAAQNSLSSGSQTLQLALTAQSNNQAAVEAAINKINGDRLQKIELLNAGATNGISELSALADQEHQHKLTEELAAMGYVSEAQTVMLVPGMYSSGGAIP
jgi:hypothetical protein